MLKRLFDFIISFVLIIVVGPLILVFVLAAAIDTKSFGIFKQTRVGQYGNLFVIYKIQTMREGKNISSIGHFFRKYKIDELPQIINVLKGDMSLVGPRPDVQGYYDLLEGDDKKLLELKPGITGLASLIYRNEEETLAQQKNPLLYNDEVLFPDKIKWNLLYKDKYTFVLDIKILWHTIFGGFPKI